MSRARASATLVLLLLAPFSGLAAPAATASGAPAVEALLNPSLEGTPLEGNGFELRHDGAAQSVLARSGAFAVDLARGPARPTPEGALGRLVAYANHPVPLGLVTDIAFHLRAPASPPTTEGVAWQLLFTLDLDADRAPDACVKSAAHPIARADAWVRLALDPQETLQVGDAACAGGAPLTLTQLQADPAYAAGTLSAIHLQTVTSAPLWPAGASVLVDDVSLLAASSPLVRIAEPARNACGGASFASILAALPCAGPGATLLVGPGTYVGTLTLDKPVTLCGVAGASATTCGATPGATVLRGSGAEAVRIRASNVTLQGLVIENPAFEGTDGAQPVATSLVTVEADRAHVRDNELRRAGKTLAPGETRSASAAVLLLQGAGIEVARNRIVAMPANQGPGADCAATRCRVTGIDAAPGLAGLRVANNTLDLQGAGRADAIQLAAVPGATVEGNAILLSPGAVGGESNVGLRAGSVTRGAIVRDNAFRTHAGEAPTGAYGVYGHFVSSAFERNSFQGLEHGLYLRSTREGGNLARWNAFAQGNEGVRNYAHATRLEGNTFDGLLSAVVLAGNASNGGTSDGVVLRANAFGTQQQALRILPEVGGARVDARENDWGAYRRGDVEARVRDEGVGNVVDTTCWIDADHATRVCPPTALFTLDPATPSWRREATFTDASVSGGRAITTRAWSFSDGATATGATARHAFAAPGAATATLKVTDTEGYTTTLTRAIDVVNRAPELAPIGDRVVAENATLTFTVSATDADGDALTYAASGLPEGATFDPATRVFSWTPRFDQEGSYPGVTFTATDGDLAATEVITLDVGHANAAPLLSLDGPTTGREGETMTFRLVATDADGDAIRLALFVLPQGAKFVDHADGTGTFTWTPTHTQAGAYPVVLQARDGQRVTEHRLRLVVADVDRAPTFPSLPAQAVAETQTLQLLVVPSDADGDILTMAAVALPAGATFEPVNGLLSWTPGYTQAGEHVARLRVSDGNLTTTGEVRIHVADTNRAPAVSGLEERAIKANRTLVARLFPADPDGDAVDLRLETPLEGASLVGNVLTWRPQPQHVGLQRIAILATDGDLQTRVELPVRVQTNLAPLVALDVPARVDVGSLMLVSAYGSRDPDGAGGLAYAWDFDPSDGFQAQRSAVNASWTFQSVGVHTLTLRARDADGIVTERVVEILVDDVVRLQLSATPDYHPVDQAHGYAWARTWDGRPIAGARVHVTIAYQPAQRAPVTLHALDVVTGPDGAIVFELPYDAGAVYLPGMHLMTGRLHVDDSYLGDPEEATAKFAYGWLL